MCMQGNCDEEMTRTVPCQMRECMVEAVYGEWMIGSCSASCGVGERTDRREAIITTKTSVGIGNGSLSLYFILTWRPTTNTIIQIIEMISVATFVHPITLNISIHCKITNPNPLLRMGVIPSMLGVCAVTTKTAAADVSAFMRGWDRKEVMKPI